jgi:hypothetical protein
MSKILIRIIELIAVTLVLTTLLHYAPKAQAEAQATAAPPVPTIPALIQELSIDVPPVITGSDPFFVKLGAFLNGSLAPKSITLKITGVGGEAMVGNKFIRDIISAQEKGVSVNMRVVGPAYSMHAFLVCFANKVTLDDGATLMFHSVYVMKTHLFGLVHIRDTSLDPASEASQDFFLNKCKEVGRLTDADIKVIKAGGDVFISHEGNRIVTTHVSVDECLEGTIEEILDIVLAVALGLLLIAAIKRI